MLGLDSYGSDSDSGGEETQVKQTQAAAPKPKPKKKITIGLSNLPKPSHDDEHSDNEAAPAPKKRKLESGAGVSSLVSMLPAPKKKGATLPPPAQPSYNPYTTAPLPSADPGRDNIEDDEAPEPPKPQTAFVPTSVRKGRPNVSVEEAASKPKSSAPAVDFFGLSSSSSTKVPLPSSTTAPIPATVSSAPTIAKFEPPEPTPTDSYPGYYQLPSGAWAAYDPDYYRKFMKKWQAEYDAHVRALEKGTAKGFEEMDTSAMQEVDAQKEMERAKVELRDLEERKALTQGAGAGPAQPNMKITASKMTGIARSRHQLSTLLREAYENREALEERIAQGKRNRKEAGNKYGF